MVNNKEPEISLKRILISVVIISLLIFVFVDINTKSPDELMQEEHLNYIKYCAEKARNNTENYIDCMNKRPDIK